MGPKPKWAEDDFKRQDKTSGVHSPNYESKSALKRRFASHTGRRVNVKICSLKHRWLLLLVRRDMS